MHDMTSSGARGALTRYEVVPVNEGNIRENIPGVSRFWTNESQGKVACSLCYDVWRTNGQRVRIRLVVLSNFHVQSIFIRVTVYFL